MGIYYMLSNQSKISSLKKNIKDLQQKIMNNNLEYAEFIDLSKENLKISFLLLLKALGPAVVSSIPVIIIAFWLQVYFSYSMPQKGFLLQINPMPEITKLVITSESLKKIKNNTYVVISKKTDNISIYEDSQVVYTGNIFSPAVPVIYKRQWWNILMENPAGYLKDASSVEKIIFNFSRKPVIKALPDWISGWELPYLAFILIASLTVKIVFRIQ